MPLVVGLFVTIVTSSVGSAACTAVEAIECDAPAITETFVVEPTDAGTTDAGETCESICAARTQAFVESCRFTTTTDDAGAQVPAVECTTRVGCD